MYQKWIGVGNIGREGELRYTPQGIAVYNFSLAVNSGWGNAKTTMWTKVTVWGKLAESISPYLLKGKQVLIEGELQVDPETGGPRTWVGGDGSTRASFEVTAREVRLLGGKAEKEAESYDKGELVEDNDIPF